MLAHRLQNWPNINPFRVGMDFYRQNLMSKVDLRTKELQNL